MRGLLQRLIPPTPLSRRLASQSLLFATAQGAFNTGSAVFFTEVVGLSAARVGLGMTIAGVFAFLVAYPAGRLVDRIGPKRMWTLGTLLSALAFAFWPWIHGFLAYVVIGAVFEIVQNLGSAGYSAYILDVLPEQERIDTQAHLYSALNLGFTLGALISGVALAFHNVEVIRWIPMLSVLVGLINAARIMTLPRAAHDERAAAGAHRREERAGTPPPVRNRGWIATACCTGILYTNQTLLTVVIPLWLVQRTDAPHWLLAWLFATNTVLCIFLPSFTSKGVTTISDALRRARISTAFFVLACVITLFSHSTVGLLTALLVWLGHVSVTGAELAIGSSNWVFQAKLMDPARRGEYGGLAEVGRTVSSFWAPAAFTYAAMRLGQVGWLLIAGWVVLGAVGLHPAARAAERFAAANFVGAGEEAAAPVSAVMTTPG
ncbi:MAG TPA: MFS transporter [Solirubrobacteraceae bacterium]|nr:MFS transporter [Solirubrobacteraceae bacterium]